MCDKAQKIVTAFTKVKVLLSHVLPDIYSVQLSVWYQFTDNYFLVLKLCLYIYAHTHVFFNIYIKGQLAQMIKALEKKAKQNNPKTPQNLF